MTVVLDNYERASTDKRLRGRLPSIEKVISHVVSSRDHLVANSFYSIDTHMSF